MKKSFIKFKTKQEKKEYERSHRGRRIFIIVSRCLILLYLLIAISSPYTLKEEVVKGDYSLKILVDNSTSMELMDTRIVDIVFDGIKEKIPVTISSLVSGTDSSIGDAIINNMHGDDNILLVTDGQNNYGKELAHVMFFASLLNTTVSALNLESIEGDNSVVIEGPSEAIKGTESELYIKIDRSGSAPDYSIHVSVDEKPVVLERVEKDLYRFSKVLSEGYHKITARLDTTDYFLENNIFYKTVQVFPKPGILYLTEEDPKLISLLNPLYTIDKKSVLPNDIKNYPAIIIDDVDASRLNSKTEILSDYVIEGGGLFVIGGENSYDRGEYQDSIFETILPVKVGEAGLGGELATNVVIVIDISESTGQDFSRRSSSKKVDVEKSLAIEILKGISLFDRVGVVAFNHKAYILSKLALLGEVEGNITSKISALQDTGGTLVYAGLKQAERLMDGSLGSKNIILISDGVDAIPSLSLDLAKEFGDKNIRLYTVGIGEATNSAFMQTLAVETGASYFEPTETEKLKILFGEREEIPSQDVQSLVLFSTDHFITKNLDINADVSGFNYVVKKASSQMLVSMGDGKPILTVWRYGLGRVLALSTDSGDKWSSELLSERNSKLLVRSINWAIGDPQKNMNFYVKAQDTNLGDTTKIFVKSDKTPVSDVLNFEKTDEDRYVAYFTPSEIGYEEFFNSVIAVNNPLEYQNIGFNKDLRDFVGITGGEMFDGSDIDELVEFIKAKSIRKKTIPNYYRWPFVIIALAILLIEIFVRKIIESIRRTK
jgi:uncharacterized membrane protein